MSKGLFRQAAIAATQQQWFAPVSVATPASAWVVTVLALFIALLLGVAVSLIEVPDRVRVPGVLLPQLSLMDVRAPRSGRVRGVEIANGDRVDWGQALFAIDDMAGMSAEQEDSLQRELQLLDSSLQQQRVFADQRIAANKNRLRILLNRLRSAREEREAQAQIAAIQAAAAERVSQLRSASAVSRQQADEYQVTALRARAEKQGLAQEQLEIEAEIAALNMQLNEDVASIEQAETLAAIQREALRRELARYRDGASLEIIAPVAGQIAGLDVRNGSHVQAGQLLLTLHEPASRIEARLYVPASQAGRIQLGQEVQLKLDAYPYQIYGTQAARVTAISAVALPAEELDIPLSLRGPVFEIRAVTTDARGLASRLPPGTVIHADLIRHRWPLLRWLLRSRRAVSVQA
jgi:membrane fusion protein